MELNKRVVQAAKQDLDQALTSGAFTSYLEEAMKPRFSAEQEVIKNPVLEALAKPTTDSLREKVASVMGDSFFTIEETYCGVLTQPKSFSLEEALDRYINHILEYAQLTGVQIDTTPKTNYIRSGEESMNIFGRTAYYDPNTTEITLFIQGRHPKDILRSYCHELIHFIQHKEGRLPDVIQTTNINQDSDLQTLEEEAYLKGNILFRSWEDSVKNQ
jgi:hypothetical protein